MKIVPQTNFVLCTQVNSDKLHQTSDLLQYDVENLPTYRIIDIGNIRSKTLCILDFKIGDEIICNSTGTKVKVDDKYYWLFNIENVAGKIELQ